MKFCETAACFYRNLFIYFAGQYMPVHPIDPAEQLERKACQKSVQEDLSRIPERVWIPEGKRTLFKPFIKNRLIELKLLAIRIIVVVFLLNILCFCPSTYAFTTKSSDEKSSIKKEDTDPSFFQKSTNYVYQFINGHEYLFTPIYTALAGGMVCGPWCAVFGSVIGTVDELLVNGSFTDKRYLTWGTFGLVTSQAIKNTPLLNGAGIALGILLPTGILNGHKE